MTNNSRAVSVQTTPISSGVTVDLAKSLKTTARFAEVTRLTNNEIAALAISHSSCGACAVFVSPSFEMRLFSEPLNKVLAAYLDFSRAVGENVFKADSVTYEQLQTALHTAILPTDTPVSGVTRYLVAFYSS